MKSAVQTIGAVLMAVPLAAASPSEKDSGCPVVFTDVAASAGLRFTHDRGAAGGHHLPETMGSGLAWLDYDNDGWMDLYVVQSGPFPPNGSLRAQDRLYRNNRNGTFTDMTAKAKIRHGGYGMGVVAADYDNDGYTDLYVTGFGRNILYHNNGDGTFTDVTARAGVGASGWSTSAAFADFDGDGFLDLIVVRYVDDSAASNYFCGDAATGRRDYCSPKLYPPTHDILFHNNGDGTFTDISASSGIDKALGKGLGVVVADVDDDGRPDIYVANDTTMNFLFKNLGGNRFEDVSLLSGAGLNSAGQAMGGMGVNAGDLDGDGKLDLIVANFEAELNSFYRNLGEDVFEDVSSSSGFGGPSFAFSGLRPQPPRRRQRRPAGRLHRERTCPGETRDARGRRTQSGRFSCGTTARGSSTSAAAGTPSGGRSSGAARPSQTSTMTATSISPSPIPADRSSFCATTAPTAIGSASFCAGRKSNRSGIGARVTIETDAGTQMREVKAGESYLSSSDPRVHFGLGSATAVRRIVIRWPSGIVQEVPDAKPGRYNTVEETSRTAN